MRTKLNLNVVAENEEEEKIQNFLEVLHESKEVQGFLEEMEKEANRRQVYKYRARVKNVNSAIRTYRINKKKLDEVHDYIGISFITNNEKEIYPIIDYLKDKFPNGDFVDFVDEESIYSPLVYIKWVPPLGYNVLANEEIIPNYRKVPVEIRVCSKEAYISEQSAYYSVQKNDTLKMPMEEKNNLRNIVQHITYKFAILDMRELTLEERRKHLEELEELINTNKEFLKKHYELCEDGILDCGRLVYRCEHENEISKDELKLSQNNIDDIDYYLKKKFLELIKRQEGNVIEKVSQALQELKKIDYLEIKKEYID